MYLFVCLLLLVVQPHNVRPQITKSHLRTSYWQVQGAAENGLTLCVLVTAINPLLESLEIVNIQVCTIQYVCMCVYMHVYLGCSLS